MKIISHHKLIASTWLIAGIICGIGISFVVSPVYIGEASLKVGSVGIYPVVKLKKGTQTEYQHTKSIETPRHLLEVVRAKYRVPEARKGLTAMPHLVDIERRPGGILRFTARASSKSEVIQILAELLQWIELRHSGIYQVAIKEVEAQREEYRMRLDRVLGLETAAGVQQLSAGAEQLSNDASQLEVVRKLVSVLAQIDYARSALMTAETSVLLKPTVNRKRIKPKPMLYFITALIVAAMGHLFTITFLTVLREQK